MQGLRGSGARQPTSEWPHQADYRSWDTQPQGGSFNCERYFGNGFNKDIELIRRSRDSRFTCHHSESVHDSICEISNVMVHPKLIRLSHGGEPLESVGRRPDDIELPRFQKGAFKVRLPLDS